MSDHDGIYCKLKRNDHNYEKNMPEIQAKMFLTLFDDEGWTWSGLAELLKARYGEGDIADLAYQLMVKS